MTSLHQVLAVERGTKSNAARVLTNAHHTVLKAPLLSGISRRYQAHAAVEDGGEVIPPESTRVQINVATVLDEVQAAMVKLFDVVATKDATNAVATADVIVGGTMLLAAVPVATLLFLEKQLTDLHTFVSKLPVLDPSEEWIYNEAADCWATPAVQTTRSKKVPKTLVAYPHSDQHPAQVQVYHEDVQVGLWTTVKYSGALPARRVTELTHRVTELQEAVRKAREAANQATTRDQEIGAAVFGYLFR